MQQRPPISRRTIPNLPWSFEPNKSDVCFVLGVANQSWPIRDKTLPKDWPVAYKTVRWNRLSILRDNIPEWKENDKQYSYRKTMTGKKLTIQDFITHSIESIRKEKEKGKIQSVHSILVVYDPHGKDEAEIIAIN